jgi:aspartate ammonia-lyase
MPFEKMEQFKNYLSGGTQIVDANPEIITKEIETFKQRYKEDIILLQKLEPLTISWGLILQWS